MNWTIVVYVYKVYTYRIEQTMHQPGKPTMRTQKKGSPIQYRPGESFGRVLADLARRWRIPKNDAAKRLAILAAFTLDVRHYSHVAELAGLIGGIHSFESAARQILVAVESEISTRSKLKQKALDENARFKLIQETARPGAPMENPGQTEHDRNTSVDDAPQKVPQEQFERIVDLT